MNSHYKIYFKVYALPAIIVSSGLTLFVLVFDSITTNHQQNSIVIMQEDFRALRYDDKQPDTDSHGESIGSANTESIQNTLENKFERANNLANKNSKIATKAQSKQLDTTMRLGQLNVAEQESKILIAKNLQRKQVCQIHYDYESPTNHASHDYQTRNTHKMITRQANNASLSHQKATQPVKQNRTSRDINQQGWITLAHDIHIYEIPHIEARIICTASKGEKVRILNLQDRKPNNQFTSNDAAQDWSFVRCKHDEDRYVDGYTPQSTLNLSLQ